MCNAVQTMPCKMPACPVGPSFFPVLRGKGNGSILQFGQLWVQHNDVNFLSVHGRNLLIISPTFSLQNDVPGRATKIGSTSWALLLKERVLPMVSTLLSLITLEGVEVWLWVDPPSYIGYSTTLASSGPFPSPTGSWSGFTFGLRRTPPGDLTPDGLSTQCTW